MTDEQTNDRENGARKLGDVQPGAGNHETHDTSSDDNTGPDAMNADAVREATRLGASDSYLVDQDMEDLDQRQGTDGPDGRPSPMANADNPER